MPSGLEEERGMTFLSTGAGTMRVSDILDILFFILRQLGLFGLCFFYIRFILMCAFSGWS